MHRSYFSNNLLFGFLFTEGLTGAFNNSGNLYAVINRDFWDLYLFLINYIL